MHLKTLKKMQVVLGLGGLILFQAGGCMIDPDIALRAGLTFASDLTIFLIDNLIVSF